MCYKAAENLPQADRHGQDREEIDMTLHEWRCAKVKHCWHDERYEEAIESGS